MKKNDRYEVEVTGMTSEGSGVVKIDQFAVFVPNTAVGDVITVKIVKVLKHYGFGIVETIVKPSASRISEDGCGVYKQCGGCCYRHISYEAELELKQQQIEDAFSRIGKIECKPSPIAGSAQTEGYRNKAQYPVGVDKDGRAVAGFFALHSHRIIPCTDCKLQPPVFNRIVSFLLEFVNQHKISVYQEESHQGILRHIYIREAQATGELMVCLVSTQKSFPKQQELAELLVKEFPNIKSFVLNHNPKRTNVILGNTCKTIWGQDYITDVLCGVSFRISPLAFYQVNKKQAENLYQKALEYANLTPEDTLLDLYCGTGTIGLTAAGRVKQLIGVEIIEQAVENAKQNAALNGITNAEFICADCKAAVKTLEDRGIIPDVIIVDPPRKGCDSEVIETICRFAPRKVVMISCNPATAARDCHLLEESGYQVEEYMPFDLFPRSRHVEVVVQLRKR